METLTALNGTTGHSQYYLYSGSEPLHGEVSMNIWFEVYGEFSQDKKDELQVRLDHSL